ncbi:Lyzozyme M1 (1,4-beta-N-acetylmuramidase), GH25 family [Bifidobacterium bohemicum]|uniref:1,4-beta-N-acetylmuramidase n=1 Tax=Bifidobacterium bohemicum DSM 22767 TaxID=1437606 RepID=A0A086ZHQ6_9BIFI|nr:RICIN domain-containing protein [Bifidobacterium bohemicum]KFI46056.1 1,4-beta-N-acetylmuramidase [Bifidobacterium bohemicum DSM 22767]SCC05787.1 Lyzozyme M1 (1,4-beta-N-acetylmuramidase), GH25 family [Bifidobacterium bohemicum]
MVNRKDSGRRLVKTVAAVATLALGLTVAVTPASALTDMSLDRSVTSPSPSSYADQGFSKAMAQGVVAGRSGQPDVKTIGDQPSSPSASDAMPENPSQKLPDKVSAAIPDDATLVSPDLAATKDGQVRNIKTGKPVTDPKVVGRNSKPADPLAKTDGQRFIPVEAKEVKRAVAANGGDANTSGLGATAGAHVTGSTMKESASKNKRGQARPFSVRSAVADTDGDVRNTALQNNEYGAYWGTYNGSQAFFERGGNLFAQQAKGVVDVSQWQGTINWEAAKASGVEGAIIRLSFGWGNGYDSQAVRNIKECRRLGIPFGVYMYSYAYDNNTAAAEGDDVVGLLRAVGVNPKDLSYPVFYDLEAYSPWSGHCHPENPWVYDGMVNTWFSRLQSAGYNNLSVYSYTSYLYNQLNTDNIHGKTRWVASYGARTGFGYSANDRGWQYADNGRINGINGNVDINAFGNYSYVSSAPNIGAYQAAALPDGTYFISSLLRDSAGFDIPGGSTDAGARAQLYDANQSAAQQYRLVRHNEDGTYEIRNVNSDKVLDVPGGNAYAGVPIQQWDSNGSNAQRWYLRNAGQGGMYIQSKLGNLVLDLPGGSTKNGTKLQLWDPNLTRAQQYIFSTVSSVSGGTKRIRSIAGNVVFDVPGASSYDGARLQVYDWNGTDAQKYNFNQVGNGIYEIQNVNSGKVVDLAGASTANGGKIDQYGTNGTCAQHWALRELSSGQYAFYSSCAADKAIDIPGGKAAKNQSLQLYDGNGTYAQRWAIETIKTRRQIIDELAAAHRSDLADGVYVIAAKCNNTMVLDVAGAARWDGARVQLYSNNGSGAQRWKVSHDGNGYVTISNIGSGKVLDINGAQDRAGVRMQQYSLNGTYAQKWIAVRDGNAFKLVSALDSGLVLDISGAGMFNGNTVQTYSDNSTVAQRWVALRQ